MYVSENQGCDETFLYVASLLSSGSISFSYNTALMVWLGLGTKTTLLGLGKDHVLS